MRALAYPAFLLACLGLILSAISHVYALCGMPGPLGDATWILHVGIFVVWFPAVIVAQRLARNVPQKDFWKAALRGCPAWARTGLYGIFGYGVLNFIYFIITVGKQKTAGPMPPPVVRGFSGHWMIFYGAAAAILYSYRQVGDDGPRKCPSGHEVGPMAQFCETCGLPVTNTPPAL